MAKRLRAAFIAAIVVELLDVVGLKAEDAPAPPFISAFGGTVRRSKAPCEYDVTFDSAKLADSIPNALRLGLLNPRMSPDALKAKPFTLAFTMASQLIIAALDDVFSSSKIEQCKFSENLSYPANGTKQEIKIYTYSFTNTSFKAIDMSNFGPQVA